MAPVKKSRSKEARGKRTEKARLHLRPDKALGSELRNVVDLQIEAALACLHGNNVSPEPVHDARTYIKKIRAILHLASPAMSKKQRLQPTLLLRDAASRLGPLRDSEVRVQTLDALLELTGLPVDDFISQRAGLVDIANQRRRNDVRQIPKVLLSLRKLRDSTKNWPLADLEGSDLRRRIRRTYRRGRTALELSRSVADADTFHLWRKQVKQLWYQLRLTSHFWKNNASDLIALTGAIGQMAGEERDLTLLAETLKLGPQGKSATLLLEKIKVLLPKLRQEALTAGITFYEPKPKIFVQDLDL